MNIWERSKGLKRLNSLFLSGLMGEDNTKTQPKPRRAVWNYGCVAVRVDAYPTGAVDMARVQVLQASRRAGLRPGEEYFAPLGELTF